MASVKDNTIKVVARFRPQNKVEIASGGEPIVGFDSDDTCRLDSKEAQGAFTFDRVFGMDSRQVDVFDYSIRSTVDDILNGYNGTVLAYGQTGAGKSFTMMGSAIDDVEYKGIIPRITEQIFASIEQSPVNIEWTVRVSYMEIYMERIKDLLKPANDNLPIHEEKNRGVYVKGLLELYVSNVQEVFEVMRRGGINRAIASTNMNQESSRSHSIFVITVTQKNIETGSAKSGMLFLVDLAGSEKVGKTGASGQTLEEAKKINKSLSALGMVINSLTDGKSSHVPYRDSKLTRILQESLGGNSRTTLIINCSPSSYNDAETLSTLRFGVRAKAIKNKAKVNAELSPMELKIMLKKAETKIMTYETYLSSLEIEVQQWRKGDPVPNDQWIELLGLNSNSLKAGDGRTPSTPGRLTTSRPDTPTRSESRQDHDRASTPLQLDKDERDEFLRRENELQDQLSEKETQLVKSEQGLKEARDELQILKEHDSRAINDIEKLNTELNELRMQLQKMNFENNDAQITMDSLKEANAELTAELDEYKQQLLDVKMSARENGTVYDEKERLKRERMAKMMAGFDLESEAYGKNERRISGIIEQLASIQDPHDASAIDLHALREQLIETQEVVRHAEATQEAAAMERFSLEQKLSSLQIEHQSILEEKLHPEDIETIKQRLAETYTAQRSGNEHQYAELESLCRQHEEANAKLRTELETLRSRPATSNGTSNGMANGKTLQQQITEFDAMKKNLMRDLQNRCERVSFGFVF